MVVEVDALMTTHLSDAVEDMRATCAAHGAGFSAELLAGDFVGGLCTNPFDPQPSLADDFDLVLMNPPYKKVRHGLAAGLGG